jgi:hypothetical protein
MHAFLMQGAFAEIYGRGAKENAGEAGRETKAAAAAGAEELADKFQKTKLEGEEKVLHIE